MKLNYSFAGLMADRSVVIFEKLFLSKKLLLSYSLDLSGPLNQLKKLIVTNFNCVTAWMINILGEVQVPCQSSPFLTILVPLYVVY